MFQRLPKKAAGFRSRHLLNFRQRPLRHDRAASRSRAGAEIDDGIRAPHGVLVVLHDDEGVSFALQGFERVEQLGVVAGVQPDGGLIEHVEHAPQVGAQLRSEADALGFSAAQRLGGAIHCQVIETDASHEIQALLDLGHDVLRDGLLVRGKLQLAEQFQGAPHGAGW